MKTKLVAILSACLLAGCSTINERVKFDDVKIREIPREVFYQQKHSQTIEELVMQINDLESKIELEKSIREINSIIVDTKYDMKPTARYPTLFEAVRYSNLLYEEEERMKVKRRFEERFINFVNKLESRKNPYMAEFAEKLKDYYYIELKTKEIYKIGRGIDPWEIIFFPIIFPIGCAAAPFVFFLVDLPEGQFKETPDMFKSYFGIVFPEKETLLEKNYDAYFVYPYRKKEEKVKESLNKEEVEKYLENLK